MLSQREMMEIQRLSGMDKYSKRTIAEELERSKLVDLIGSVEYGNGSLIGNNFQTGFIEKIADHLITNGVTVGKPLTEYLHPVDNYAGLKGKYLVFKADTGEQVADCFVLRPAKDTAAMEALRAYANATDNKTLSNDIYNWVGDGGTVQEWIPVSERLPELERTVLVIDRVTGEITTAHLNDFNSFVFRDGRGHGASYWMPLPEKPKEG